MHGKDEFDIVSARLLLFAHGRLTTHEEINHLGLPRFRVDFNPDAEYDLSLKL